MGFNRFLFVSLFAAIAPEVNDRDYTGIYFCRRQLFILCPVFNCIYIILYCEA